MNYKQFVNGISEYFDFAALMRAIMVGKIPEGLRQSSSMREFYGKIFKWTLRVLLVVPFLCLMYVIFVLYKLLIYSLPYGIYLLASEGEPKAVSAPVLTPEELNRVNAPQVPLPEPQSRFTANSRPTAVVKQQHFPEL